MEDGFRIAVERVVVTVPARLVRNAYSDPPTVGDWILNDLWQATDAQFPEFSNRDRTESPFDRTQGSRLGYNRTTGRFRSRIAGRTQPRTLVQGGSHLYPVSFVPPHWYIRTYALSDTIAHEMRTWVRGTPDRDVVMILRRLLSGTGKKNLANMDQDGLIRIVHGDDNLATRREACRHLTVLSELKALADEDPDTVIRDVAGVRYRRLLCGQEENPVGLDERASALAAEENPTVLEQVAAHADAPELRLAAIRRVDNTEVLANCVINDGLAANRAGALERIEDKDALERIAKGIGKRDKTVYRLARHKLKEIAEREAEPERIRALCAELCERLERLGRFDSWEQDRAALEHIDRQWAEISEQAEPEWHSRIDGLRARFIADYEEHMRLHAAEVAAEENRAELRELRQALLEELAALRELDDADAIASRTGEIEQRWGGLEALPHREQANLERRFSDLVEEIRGRGEHLRERREHNARLAARVETLEGLVAQSEPLDAKRLRGLLDEGRRLSEEEGMDRALAARFGENRKLIEERLRKQRQHVEHRLEQLPEKLAELESAIEEGELKRAEPLFQSIHSTIDLASSSGVSHKSMPAASERLHQLGPRVRELQKWRKWGADQHRDALCTTMEELITADMPLEAVALKLHDLQMEWKGLDKGGSPVNQSLWDRFHALSEQVYERCRPYLDEQAAERDANRAAREALIAELEAFLEKVDWERMDWKKALRAQREMRQAWADIGPVEARQRKALERRFRHATKALETHLHDERERNQKHKRDLIERVEGLIEEPDLERAIEETKQLQRQWHTTVPARQKDENKLWQRFRGACDAVFNRRRERQEAYLAELNEHLRVREAICEEAERAAAEVSESHAIDSARRELEARWLDNESLTVPRQAAGALAQRWRAAREALSRRRKELDREQRRQGFALLHEQGTLCERLERMVEDGAVDDDALAKIESEWDELGEQRNADLQRGMRARFDAALEAARAGETGRDAFAERLAENGRQRAELCLHLEILAQVDSPPELTQERLEFQVARLKGRMTGGGRDPLVGTASLLQQWYLCGVAPAADSPALEQRFQRVWEALEGEPESQAA